MAHAGALSLTLIFATLAAASVEADRNYGKLPLAFEQNTGQTDSQALFLTRGHGMTTFFTESGAVVTLDDGKRRAAVRMNLAAARPARAVGLEKLPGVANYFIGADPTKWRTNIPTYARIRYQDVYPGVDLVWYGNQRQLEYDFVVAPGADPGQIQVAYDGVESLRIDDGDLVLRTALGDIRQKRPRVYQEIGGQRVEVAARYTLRARRRVSFELARYDRTRELRIDPVVLVYWTPVAGAGRDEAHAIAVDAAGSAYITGWTNSADFPTRSAYQPTLLGMGAAFVMKLTPAGDALVYSTFLGGRQGARSGTTSGSAEGSGIAVDQDGAAYVAGYTDWTDFPTKSAVQASYGGHWYDAFVTKLSPAGNELVYSTYLGGSGIDQAKGIAVSASGSAFVTGYTYSSQFPTHSPLQTLKGHGDAFVTSLSPSGDWVYSTYLGGSADDYGAAIAVDAAGSAYVTGATASTAQFPTALPYQATHAGGRFDCFVTKLSPAGDRLIYSTFLGGSNDDGGRGIAVDQTGAAYIAGHTLSKDFPTKGAYSSTATTAFMTKLAPSGKALVYSTFLGPATPTGIAVDTEGSAYVTGRTSSSSSYPVLSPYQASPPGKIDVFVTKLNPAGNALSFSTYLGGPREDYSGGIALDAAGAVYIAGWTKDPDPASMDLWDLRVDAFVAKLELSHGVVIATNPAGLAYVVDGVPQTAPHSAYAWTPGTTHTIGVPLTPQQGQAARYTFVRWSDGGAQFHSVLASSEDVTYTAEFKPQFRFTVTTLPAAGGTVSISPAPRDGYYDSGTRIRLTARANPGYQFLRWWGDEASTSINDIEITVTRESDLTALFVSEPRISAVVDSASGRPVIAPDSFVTIYGSSLATDTSDWNSVIQYNALPTTLGDAQVRINGKDCYISHAQLDQLNVLTPHDTASGSVTVEVITPQGTATSTAVMAPAAPALYGYSLSGRFYAVAQIVEPNATTLVAPVGAFGLSPSRPAQGGDYLTLWALGLGGTNPVAPSGRLLNAVYPVSDLSRVKAKIGGVDAPVLWAGLVMPGVFQINVQAPPGLSGDQPVVLTVDGAASQPNAFLLFR